MYIEKNAELIKEVQKGRNAAQYLNETIDKFEGYTKFLYVMNGKMLRMLTSAQIPFPVSPEEIDITTEIKEALS